MINMIFLIGVKTDIHLTRLQNELDCRGIDVEILDPFEDDQLHLESGNETGQFNAKVRSTSGKVVDVNERALVWHRVKVLPIPEPTNKEQQLQYLQLTEKKAFWRNLNEISEIRFINSFDAIEHHRSKALQLRIANDLRLDIPPTCISNSPKEIENFRHKAGDCLIKPLMTPRVPGQENVTPLSMHAIKIDADEHIDEAEFEAFPMIIQQYIEKLYEIRIFVFGNSVKAFRIDSQNSKKGQVDWRLAQEEDIFEEIDIPFHLESLVIQYLKISQLDTGSFDFIVNKSGKYIFLECNPSGQWGWLERSDSNYLPITNLIADELAKNMHSIQQLMRK